jgi:hypothetical protein
MKMSPPGLSLTARMADFGVAVIACYTGLFQQQIEGDNRGSISNPQSVPSED